jgi:hypothetical protein
MKAARKFLQIVRFTMVISIVAYAIMCWRLPSSATPNAAIFRILTLLAISLVVAIFMVRRIYVSPAEAAPVNQPQDAGALNRWRQGYLVTWALSEAIALYGVVLHFMGFPLLRVGPFLLTGIVLMLYFGPKLPLEAEFPSRVPG